MKIYPAYMSKHNLNHEEQINFSIIPNGEEWPYFTPKTLYALLRGITS